MFKRGGMQKEIREIERERKGNRMEKARKSEKKANFLKSQEGNGMNVKG